MKYRWKETTSDMTIRQALEAQFPDPGKLASAAAIATGMVMESSYSFPEIGERMRVSPETARDLVKWHLTCRKRTRETEFDYFPKEQTSDSEEVIARITEEIGIEETKVKRILSLYMTEAPAYWGRKELIHNLKTGKAETAKEDAVAEILEAEFPDLTKREAAASEAVFGLTDVNYSWQKIAQDMSLSEDTARALVKWWTVRYGDREKGKEKELELLAKIEEQEADEYIKLAFPSSEKLASAAQTASLMHWNDFRDYDFISRYMEVPVSVVQKLLWYQREKGKIR